MPKIDHYTLQTLLKYKPKNRIESKCVADVQYDPETSDMTVTFQARGTYVYHDVPLDVYTDFETSGSRGTYFNSYIKENYNYERVA